MSGNQNSISCTETSNVNNLKSALVEKNQEPNPTQKTQLPLTSQTKKTNKSTNDPASVLVIQETTVSTNNNNLGSKTKSAKYSKNLERCHTKHQLQQHAQLHHIYNNHLVDGVISNGSQIMQNNYHMNESSFVDLNQNLAYKFNSNYHASTHLENNIKQTNNSDLLVDNKINYYSQNIIKSELIDEPNAYESKIKFSTISNPEFSSSLSTSSVCSTASSSLPIIPADSSISVNISNSGYHYGNYFNGLNQSSYVSSRYLHESQNKLYAGSSSSSSSPFYINSHNATVVPSVSSQNSSYNFYNHNLGQHYSENINETSNLHSNSSCSSTSSISSSNSVNCTNSSVKNNISNLFNENSYNNNSFAAAAAVGILWPKSIDSELNHQHYHSFNHGVYESESTSHLVVNNQLTVPNNYNELTGSKYSCGTSSNLYSQYPFVTIDDYNSSVSQI